MKKVFIGIGIILLVFIVLLYWSLSGTSKEFDKSEIVGFDSMETIDFKKHDSILIAASILYKADDIKTLMQGEHYREAWSTPVKIPVVYLDTLKGGLEIVKEGGGKQTKSLKLNASNGISYTLRSINKDPNALVPEYARVLGLENIVVDGISAQHPYGAILAAKLAETANVMHTHPQAVFVPKQPRLDDYNDTYGNKLYLLEYETEGKVNWTSYKNVESIIETDELQEMKLKYRDLVSIDRPSLVRTRLFDLLIGDWDRHAKQWGWIVQQQENKYVAYPLPGDRDNAFFNVDGIIPLIMSNENVVSKLRPFEKEIDFMPGLIYPFDRYFLLNTPEEIFIEEARQLQLLLTDDAIDEALKAWPPKIAAIDGKEIAEKIKSRRDELTEYALQFKKIVDEKGQLKKPLQGSQNDDFPEWLTRCFECTNLD